MSFDAGSLLFKIQTEGAKQAARDLSDVAKAADQAGQKAQSGSKGVDEFGKATDRAGKQSKQAKASVDGETQSRARSGDAARSAAATKRAAAKQEAEAARAAAKAEREAAAAAKERADAAKLVGQGLLAGGAAAAAMVTVSVGKFAEFDQGMSNVQAATHESAENMQLLREAAIQAGADSVFSATEAAAGVEELAKAGVSVKDVLGGGLTGALDLAAAGEISVADAAETAASTMTQFGLKGADVTHIADLLAAGAGKAQGGVSDLSGALNQSGLVASQMGLSVEETVGTLANFASAGMIGSDAGTSFRNMLLRLANPTGEAATLMDQLGLSFYDSQGQFIGMEATAGQLQDRLSGLTEEQRNAALASLFGQDAIRAASILYEGGAESVAEWTDAVNDSGYASETAATRLDNLKGDWEAMTGALDTALITMGSAADGPLRGLVQGLTGVIDAFNALPDGVQQSVLVIGGVLAAVGLVGGAMLLAVPKVAEFRTALTTLGVTGSAVKGKLTSVMSFLGGPWGLALTAGVTVLGAFASAHAEAEGRIQSYTDALKQEGPAAEKAVSELATATLQLKEASSGNFFKYGFFNKSALDAAEQLGLSLERVQGAAQGSTDDLAYVNAELEKATGFDDPWKTGAVGLERTATNAAIVSDAISQVSGDISEAQDRIDQAAEATDGLADSTAGNADAADDAQAATEEMNAAIQSTAEAAQATQEEIDALADAIRNYTTDAYGVQEAHDNINQAINDSVEKFKEFVEAGVTGEEAMHGTTNVGIGMRDMFADIEATARDSAVALRENGEDVSVAMEAYRQGRDRVVDMLTELGVAPSKAKAWAAEMYGPTSDVKNQLEGVTQAAEDIPENEKVDVKAETATATEQLEALGYKVKHMPDGTIRVSKDGQSFALTESALNNLARDRTAHVYVQQHGRVVTSGGVGGGTSGHLVQADGGVVDYFANGGLSEHHVAQIAAAGTYRVWAEDETEGEGYVPLAKSKRARSEMVMQEIANRFGGLYIPGGVRAFADGGMTMPARQVSQAAGPMIGTVNITQMDPADGTVSKLAWLMRQKGRGGRG